MAWRSATARGLLAIMFFAIAWFWILSPTQNPWYWCWAIPFLPFLKRPAPWLVLGGMLFLYYLRFYFEQHYAQTPVAGTPYAGVLFFDFVIPWIEFTPVYLWAIGAWVMRFGITRGTATGTES